MKQFNVAKGKSGEQQAVEYLKNKGYKIISRNWRSRYGEIDIIAIATDTDTPEVSEDFTSGVKSHKHSRSERSSHSGSGEVLVFVEVKTKTSDQFGEPWEMVDGKKLAQISQMAEAYMAAKHWSGAARIDVIGIWPDKIDHWENI